MIERILVAVDDSPPALAAGALAIELAAAVDGRLHLVTVADGGGSSAALDHVANLARAAQLDPVTTTARRGQAFEALLAIASDWSADLVVMGRSDRRRPGAAYVGSQTEHLLEFTHIPVLVVPDPSFEQHTRRQHLP